MHQDEHLGPRVSAPFFDDELDGRLDARTLIDVARRRWKAAAALYLAVVVATLSIYLLTPREYAASATLQITRFLPLPFAYGNMPWSEELWDKDYYPTQHRLLRSRGLAERVVRQLRLAENETFAPDRARVTEAGADEAPAPELDQVEVGRLAENLLADLTVQPIKETHLVQVTFRSSSPELSALVANGVADAFIDWNVEHHAEMVDQAAVYLDQQIEAVEESLAEGRARLDALGGPPESLTDDPGALVALQRLRTLNADYVAALVESIAKEGEYEQLHSASDELVAERLSGDVVTELRQQQLRLELEYANKLETYKPEWPEMVELQSRIEKGRRHLGRTVQETVRQARQTAWAEAQAAKARTEALERQIELSKSQLLSVSSVASEQSNLQVEVETQRHLLDELLRMRSETQLASRLQSTRDTNVRVVEQALFPSRPIHPVLQRYLSTGLGLGLGVALALVFLLEYLDRTIKTPRELEQATGVQVLTVVPDLAIGGHTYGYWPRRWRGSPARANAPVEGAQRQPGPVAPDLVTDENPWHAVAEMYRNLGSALLFTGGRELGTVAVTSAQSGEGKTTTTANLAVVLSQLGKRVLVVDGDLRRPRLHQVFGTINERGLVDFLTRRSELADAVVATRVAGVDLMPAGTLAADPWKLLASTRIEELFSLSASCYEIVVLDTPPLLAVSDPFLVGRLVDGVVLCLEYGRISREEAVACVDRLDRSGTKILGAVFNRARREGGGYGYPGYSYYYSQSQAYGGDRRQKGSAS